MKVDGVGGFGDSLPVDADFESTSGVKEVEALERILGVANDTDVFLKPCVFIMKLTCGVTKDVALNGDEADLTHRTEL